MTYATTTALDATTSAAADKVNADAIATEGVARKAADAALNTRIAALEESMANVILRITKLEGAFTPPPPTPPPPTPPPPLTVPGAPTIGSAVAGDAHATVSFGPPASNGGSSITSYTVTSTPGGPTATGASSPLTVTGLTNATAYTFKVTARNAVGSGPDSSASNSVTPTAALPPPPPPPPLPTPLTVPGVPTIGSAVAGYAQATVSFGPPASNGGSSITSYTAISTPGNLTSTGASSPLTVTGLTNATAYTFRVRATNAVGNGSDSSASNSVTPTPPPTPPPSAMWVGVDAGGWSAAADIKGSVNYVRLDTPNSSRIASYVSAGVSVLDLIAGPYNSGGVSALDANAWAANAVATYRASPSLVAIEILNEPGGSWFWGSNALNQTNATAYAHLLKTVHDAFGSGAKPLLLASYDGGFASGSNWWAMVKTGDASVASYIDGVTVHPYGGTGSTGPSALGNRANVTAAHTATALPVFITEVGWPTAVGQPSTGDSLQWSEANQATNIYNFVNWARGTGYVGAVIIFNYSGYGTNMWYGITRLDQSHKKSYEDLRRASLGLPQS